MTHDDKPNLFSRLDRIAEKLDQLRKQDLGFLVFGSDSHRYRLRPPLSDHELLDMERRIGGSLPIEYRLFVSRVGHGGAGPYYGLFPLDDQDPEDITDFDRIQKPFRWSEAFNPYDLKDPCNQEDIWCDEYAEEGQQPQAILQVPGALYIANYGCAISFFLIVTGQCQGEVWRDSQADDDGIVPECNESGMRLGFFDWYEKWLDANLSR
jgi:hypothetical protein